MKNSPSEHEKLENPIIKKIQESHRSGCSLKGALGNVLTACINEHDAIGGWSVILDEKEDEIFCYQHPDAGNGEILFSFTEEEEVRQQIKDRADWL